jgi:hypothetical protein
MSDDIVKRLRARAATVGLGKNFGYYTDASAKTDTEAADEIERLRAQVAALREALALFTCDCAPKIECADPSYCRNSIARAALEKK